MMRNLNNGVLIRKKKIKIDKRYRRILTVLAVAAAITSIIYLVISGGDPRIRFLLGAVAMGLSGQMILRANGLNGSYGLYLLGSRRGIRTIGRIAKRNTNFWKFFADWGLAMGFGLLGYLHFRKSIDKRAFILGIASILLIILLVFPYLTLMLDFIPQIGGKVSVSAQSASQPQFNYLYLLLIVASLAGGFSLSTMLLILYSGVNIIYVIFIFLRTVASSNPNYNVLTQQLPGVAPVIPGLTIPFVAGICSLFILLMVHEFSHGIMARVSKIKIKSIGVVLFGIIPFGAFVEPDESAVKKLKKKTQERIFIAGISANMLVSLFFFLLTLLLIYLVLPNINTGGILVTGVVQNAPAYNVIPVGSVIIAWGNQTIRNPYDLANIEAKYIPGAAVSLLTSNGLVDIVPTNNGKLGVLVSPAKSTGTLQVSDFAYSVFVLSFALNFFVAIFNLLPIPGFDGWRIYQNSIKNKKLLHALFCVVLISILLNALPWIWTI